MYTITRLVYEELAIRGWRKSELVEAMGYKNQGRGMKRLNECLVHGDCTNQDLLKRLAKALELQADRLAAAVQETQMEIAVEEQERRIKQQVAERASFRPYIYVTTEKSRPDAITAAAVIGPRLKYLRVDDADLRLPRHRLVARAGEIVREHYRSNLGKCLLFGRITGYQFRVTYDETVVLDINGTVLEDRHGLPDEDGHPVLQVGHKGLRTGLFSVI